MSINQRYGVSDKHVRLGKFWPSIDFEFDNFNKSDYIRDSRSVPIGRFIIGNSEFAVTYSELNKIIETCIDAQSAVDKIISMDLPINR